MVETTPAAQLEARIRARTATVAVVGLGYVGLPLLRAFFQAGFPVLGYDIDAQKIAMLKRGESYLKHLGTDFVRELAKSPKFHATSDPTDLAKADAIILCVPTPLGAHGEPDMSFILTSTQMVGNGAAQGPARLARVDDLPGHDPRGLPADPREDRSPRGPDYFLAFSPEREDPGRKDHSTQTIPKLVGGVDDASCNLATMLYAAAIKRGDPGRERRDRRAAKLLENIYRCVNIALVNELKPVLAAMGIDIWKVDRGRSTKPFGFQAFYPGPGSAATASRSTRST
jgi:UDP-N-acetyl-D-glucosamine dehydrogenase